MFVPVKRFDPSQSSSSSPPKRPKVEHKATVDESEQDPERNDLNVEVDPKYEAVFNRFRDMLSKIPLSLDSENRQKKLSTTISRMIMVTKKKLRHMTWFHCQCRK